LHFPEFHINNQWILAQRGEKNQVNPNEPYAFLVEKERLPNGSIEEVATIFLTNKECPFRCLMCDLWKNTIEETVPHGSIPQQIAFALERLPGTKQIKLYNSGNFFDAKAIPVQDYPAIAEVLSGFDTVLVENHPKLMNPKVLDFKRLLNGTLQIAIGLETVHPEVLPRLNKQMTMDDFRSSVQFLTNNGILSRAFILLRPPFLSEEEGIEWAKKSIDFAFEAGVECCAIIPTRPGNGALEELAEAGLFQSPKISSLEVVLDYGISLNKGRVFADLWDLARFSECDYCFDVRKDRLDRMNLDQIVLPRQVCRCQLVSQ
jgi:radical SAM enzyme (TIGR01210 family)